MSSPRTLFRKTVVGLFVAAALGVAFLVASLQSTFKYWPWTLTTTYESGEAFGFRVGATKAEALTAVIELQHSGPVLALNIFESGRTYSEQYRGTPARAEDLSRVSLYDRWHVGLTECNCWLLLDFDAGRIARITHKAYRGPTE